MKLHIFIVACGWIILADRPSTAADTDQKVLASREYYIPESSAERFRVRYLRVAPAERKWKVITTYDYYFPENSGAGLKTQLDNQANTLILSGYNSATYTVDTKGGTGARGGILFPFGDRLMLGGTLGYVLGPTINANFSATNTMAGNGGLTISRAVSYVRTLMDFKVNLANSGRWGFDLDSEWGAGYGSVTQSCTASGSLTCPFTNSSRHWVGFTWELSPMVSLNLKNASLMLAPRYAGFPWFAGNDQIPSIQWRSFGISFGAAF